MERNKRLSNNESYTNQHMYDLVNEGSELLHSVNVELNIYQEILEEFSTLDQDKHFKLTRNLIKNIEKLSMKLFETTYYYKLYAKYDLHKDLDTEKTTAVNVT
ncbi:MAG: hypothetical protein RLN62_07150 [Rickettsiales bacterium]